MVLEAGEHLAEINELQRHELLKHSAEEAFEQLNQISSEKLAETDEDLSSEDATTQLILDAMSARLFSIPHGETQENAGLTIQEANEQLESQFPGDANFEIISTMRLPNRLATEYLRFANRLDELERYASNKPSLDAVRNGPKFFAAVDRKNFDVSRDESYWLLRLPLMNQVDLWAEELDDVFLKLTTMDAQRVKSILRDAKLRRIMDSLSVRHRTQLLDTRDVIHRWSNGADAVSTKAELASTIDDAIGDLRVALDQPWSPVRRKVVEGKLVDFAGKCGFANEKSLKQYCFLSLFRQAIREDSDSALAARASLAELYKPTIDEERIPGGLNGMTVYQVTPGEQLSHEAISQILAARFTDTANAETLARHIVLGDFGNMEGLTLLNDRVFARTLWSKLVYLLLTASLLSVFAWLFIDINRTSAHGFYRDRLAQAFLFEFDSDGVVHPAADIRLSELCDYRLGVAGGVGVLGRWSSLGRDQSWDRSSIV